jgi:hypothetical protein
MMRSTWKTKAIHFTIARKQREKEVAKVPIFPSTAHSTT